MSAPSITVSSNSTATLGGSVSDDGNAAIVARGIVYAQTTTNVLPRIGGPGVVDVATAGTLGLFTIPVSGLSSATTYAFTVYATNSLGTAYSTTVLFTTLPEPRNTGEVWQQMQFGSDATNPLVSGWTADPDHDGVANLLERAFNLNPTQSGSPILTAATGTAGLPLIQWTESPPAFSIQYLRRKASTNSGLTYTPQFSLSLDASGDWSAITGPETVESIDSEWERVTVEENSNGEEKRFGRVKVSSQ